MGDLSFAEKLRSMLSDIKENRSNIIEDLKKEIDTTSDPLEGKSFMPHGGDELYDLEIKSFYKFFNGKTYEGRYFEAKVVDLPGKKVSGLYLVLDENDVPITDIDIYNDLGIYFVNNFAQKEATK